MPIVNAEVKALAEAEVGFPTESFFGTVPSAILSEVDRSCYRELRDTYRFDFFESLDDERAQAWRLASGHPQFDPAYWDDDDR